jgi:hypothetical protein
MTHNTVVSLTWFTTSCTICKPVHYVHQKSISNRQWFECTGGVMIPTICNLLVCPYAAVSSYLPLIRIISAAYLLSNVCLIWRKNMKKYLFFWVTWLCSTAKWRWTIYFTCTSIITKQNTSVERESNCATASHGISIGCVYEHNVFAQIFTWTVHLHYSTVYFKSYLSCIGRARSACGANISVTFYDWCCLNNIMAHLTSFCYGT